MVTDLNELILFLVSYYPTYRFNLVSWQNTGGYQADIANRYGHGDTPLTAVLNLIAEHKLTMEDFNEWAAVRPSN